MNNDKDIIDRLSDACNGHPSAKIAWPHRLLHDAIAEIKRLRTPPEAQGIEKIEALTEAIAELCYDRRKINKDNVYCPIIEAARRYNAMQEGK